MTDQAQTRITAAEFLAQPETTVPMQLLEGEIIVTPAPELAHQSAVLQTASLLKLLAKHGTTYIAPVDVMFDEENVPQPDVLWIGPASKCQPVEGKYLRGAPDLIVEVLSPGTARLDRGKKFKLYEQHGVGEYWLIDLVAQVVEVWRLQEDRFTLQGVFGVDESFPSAVLGNIVIQVAAIFER